jgi:hypothetical protein
MNSEIQLNQIEELLPNYVCLHYVDYRDNLNGQVDLLQSCITDNSLDKVAEFVYDAFIDSEEDAMGQYMQRLRDDVVGSFDLDKNEADRLVFETYEDEIRDMLYNKNNSDPVKDLMRNTDAFSIFLDTGLEIDTGSWQWTKKEQTSWLNKIKRKFKINTTQWDKNIRMMLSQASYGGQLVVYFYETADSLITGTDKEWKSVSFTNPAIAIINTCNGSGNHTHLKGHTFSLPFVRENIFIDKYFKYNYVSRVCDMSQDWCEDSQASFSIEKIRGKKSAVSPLVEQALEDRKFAENYRKGSCSFYDSDITRHRDVYYRNDYPCGDICPHCGRVWVD